MTSERPAVVQATWSDLHNGLLALDRFPHLRGACVWIFPLFFAGALSAGAGCGLSDKGLGTNLPDATGTAATGGDGSGGVVDTTGTGGTDTGAGGVVGSGGVVGTGGRVGSGGTAAASGGRGGAGGVLGTGGVVASGGSGAGGRVGTGGAGTGGIIGTGGAAAVGGAGGVSAVGGRGGAGGRGGVVGTGGRAGGTGGAASECGAVTCATGRLCCNGSCVNPQNDPLNCGTCGKECVDATSYCSAGTCQAPPCSMAGNGMGMGMGTGNGGGRQCSSGGTCCGSSCCPDGDLCCASDGPVSGNPTCHHPTVDAPSCPVGCAPTCVSDRNVKKNITPVDTAEILAKVSRLPISAWTYNSEPDAVRHLGPMAQDFYASFGLGDSDRSYHSVDGHGVALAAIQALDRLVEAERTRVKALEAENQALTKRIDALERATRTRRTRATDAH